MEILYSALYKGAKTLFTDFLGILISYHCLGTQMLLSILLFIIFLLRTYCAWTPTLYNKKLNKHNCWHNYKGINKKIKE